MLTVKELKRFLNNCPDDMVVQTEQNDEIVHMVNMNDNTLILSKNKPIGYCKRSGYYVYPTDNQGCEECGNSYVAFSPALDEDLFSFEFHMFTEDELKEKAKECL